MKRTALMNLLGVVLAALVAVPAGTEELTVKCILVAQQAGAPAGGIIAMVDNLVQLRKGFWKKNREGRLLLSGDTLSWENAHGSSGDFQFQTTGLDKVWFTCEARSSGDFCHQINFKIVKGDSYHFQDSRRDTGSNAAVLEVMDALRRYQPRLNFSTPNVND